MIEEYLGDLEEDEKSEDEEAYVQNVSLKERNIKRGHYFQKWIKCMIMMAIGIWCTKLAGAEQWSEKKPDIGDIYNCEKSIHKGVFAFPSEKECMGEFHSEKTEKFLAEVRIYKKEITKVDLYFCEAIKVDKICDENYLTAKDRNEVDKMVEV